ncbi:predicted protein [Nematostella vectensis]|uniref:Serine/threonine-protein kinase receptor n=1 Tax=Nematostella vectensis TaxID=45351 RepID=A7T0S6_NEMVE|nr:predicted protein [Nematostella vectensis]|eukprot:XP_001622534.1 predicted protein [Nematostella vectensis]
MKLNRQITCKCDYCQETNSTCVTKGACLTILQRDSSTGEVKRGHACTYNPPADRLVCEPGYSTERPHQLYHCCYYNMCNVDTNVTLPSKTSGRSGRPSTAEVVAMIVSPVLVICLATVSIIYCYQKRNPQRQCILNDGSESPEEVLIPAGKSLCDLITNADISTGSGSGLPLLVQRTVARQITPIELIGSGRYGDVYRGQWRGEDVAVKIFSSREECSWFREAQIYQTVMLRHENILGFIAADNKDNGAWTQLWLITDYHANGSLYDYLQRVTLDMKSMLKLTISIASGLAHLHMEIIGTQGKPAIAHRDLKSRNILVKDNGTCCIADLGLAVCHNSEQDTLDIPYGNRVGTRRYMAPEFLEDSNQVRNFCAYKHGDIYAFGLVLWEITRRCICSDKCEDYQLPYFDKICVDPSIEEVWKVVCLEKYRPSHPNYWLQDQVMMRVAKLMQECWHHSPEARLPALRIKKTLQSLYTEECSDHCVKA